LREFGAINLVGKSFGVLKLRVKNFEFDSLSQESKKRFLKVIRGLE